MYLIFLIIPIILSAEESTNSFTSWRTAYITSVEEGEYVTVFNKPGLNWKYCDKEIDPKTGKEKCKDAVGWLAAGSRVKVYSEEPKKAITQDPITGEWLEETYIRVDYVYGRPDNEGKSVLQFGSGYVEAYNVSDQPKPTFFGTPAKNMFESLPKENPSCPQSQPITGMKDKEQDCQRITTALENMGVNRTAEKLNEIVGFCAINPPDKFPKRIPRGNPYDDFIYSQLVKKKPPEITGMAGP
jgi:hypothetical protein